MCTIETHSAMSSTLSWKDRLSSSLQGKRVEKQNTTSASRHTKESESQPQQEKKKKIQRGNKRAQVKKTNTLITQQEPQPRVYLLHSEWSFYYHDPTSVDWTNDSYVHVGKFRTIDDFSAYYKQLQFDHNYQGMFFLMRCNIKPTWEDPANIRGGCWSFKISLEHFYDVWKHLSILMVGESLCTIPLLINGISVSPKRGFCIVKIWNHDSKHDNMDLLRVSGVDHLEDNGPALYTSFDKKK